jgi:hypothetical protein
VAPVSVESLAEKKADAPKTPAADPAADIIANLKK